MNWSLSNISGRKLENLLHIPICTCMPVWNLTSCSDKSNYLASQKKKYFCALEPVEPGLNLGWTRLKQVFALVGSLSLIPLGLLVHTEEERILRTGVYKKPTHTDQYLLFQSHHPLEHKLGVIRTLQRQADNVPTSVQAQEEEQTQHPKDALKSCRWPGPLRK